MTTLHFLNKYSYAQSQGGVEVEVIVTASDGGPSVRIMAKVDTGATYCVFQRRFAEWLGIDVESGDPRKIATATGTFPVFVHQVRLSCLGHHYEASVCFAKEDGFKRNVVGQIGWLDQFRIALIHHDSQLYLSPYDA